MKKNLSFRFVRHIWIPFSVLALCLGSFIGLSAMDWPVTGGALSYNFGGNDHGRPFLGIAFESGGPIRSADAGELVFAHHDSHTASRLPSPLGAWVAIEHGDGIVGIYSRFEDSEENSLPNIIEKNTIIAFSGQSGWTSRDGFYFSFFDRKKRWHLNPQAIIGTMPDTRPPVIRQVRLKNAEGALVDPLVQRVIPQGRYSILVDAVDTRLPGDDRPLAPYLISSLLNGAEAGGLLFETYSARDGELMVYRNGLTPVREVYAAYPSYEIGEVRFTRGQALLEIIVQDAAELSRTAQYRLTIE